jgi:hypothetical protein
MIGPRSLLPRLVAGAARGAWRTLGVCAVLLALAIAYTAGHFAMTTDTGELINPHTPWRQDSAAIEKAFPALKDLILIVVDGQTPELAEDAAQRLTGALEDQGAGRAGAGRVAPRWRRLFRSQRAAVCRSGRCAGATRKLIDAQPLLGGLAADPSLHGIATTLDHAGQGRRQRPAECRGPGQTAGQPCRHD